MMTKVLLIALMIVLTLNPRATRGGLGPSPDKNTLIQQLYGAPCECRGGTMETPVVPRGYTHMQDCGGITAYLVQEYKGTGASQSWQCYHKPKPLPPRATCPCSTFQESMHSMCYSSYQQCIGANNKTYFTAILQNNKSPTISEGNKYLQAGCTGTPGTPVCWNTRAPTHMSDGGGPQDAVRQIETRRQIEEVYRHLYPQLNYHP